MLPAWLGAPVFLLAVVLPLGTPQDLAGLVALDQIKTTRADAAAAGWVNVKADFGATGDGSTDDAAAIQLAIDYCRNETRVLFFPSGTYRISRWLDWTNWNAIAVRGGEPGNSGMAHVKLE